MTEELNKVKRIRRSVRRAVETKLREVEDGIKGEELDVTMIIQWRDTLEEKRDLLKGMDQNWIEMIDDEEEAVADMCEADKFRETLGAMIHKIDVLLSKRDDSPVGHVSSLTPTSGVAETPPTDRRASDTSIIGIVLQSGTERNVPYVLV